jgi:DNA-binding SARP family transcriptional activator/tetratricopeptide (TPR) repeat protein
LRTTWGALVEFRVLGGLEVRADGRRVDVGHARQRSVLAVLLLDLGRVVPAGQLIDRVWGENPPGSVRNVLSGYVARLRAAIAGAGDPDVTLARRPGGYLLEADPDRVDLCRFRRLVAEAGAVAGDDERARPLLTSALGLWRGPALAGLDSPWLTGMRDALDMERVAAVLDLGDVALRQGRHGALVGELAGEALGRPADERMIGQLMLALYRSGRQAEALRWYEQTRRRLAGEFGADPGPQLQALHQRILRADPSLAAPAGHGTETASRGTETASHGTGSASQGTGPSADRTGGASRTDGLTPRELPADVTAFTGRAAELAELDRLLTTPAVPGSGGTARAVPEPGAQSGAAEGTGNAVRTGAGGGGAAAAVISAVSGTAGVGKTALAVHWAHRAAERFPDGQLYVNLRGYDPGPPLTAADALAGFLRALGVAGQDIPAETDERAARYRSLLARRRMLVVADNAGDEEQVRPLLPGSQACVVVVTSRDSLAGLVARDGARRLDLDLLPLAEAVGLLGALIGDRVDADPGAAVKLAGLCSRLPLALRVAAEFVASRPAVLLAELAGELADQQSRLDLLDAGGDPRTAVRAVFFWSYRHLDLDAARAFRLLGLHPGPDLEAYAAAALTGTAVEHARQLLDVLARAHLIQPAGPGRYGLHDLLRAYAAGQATVTDSEQERRAALTRLFDHYLHTAAAAMDTLFPAETSHRPRIPAPATPGPPVTEPGTARAWLDAERANLAAVAAHAAGHGWPSYSTRLAATLFRYLDTGGHQPEAVTIHSHARRAASAISDSAAEATALSSLAGVDLRQGRYELAVGRYQQAVALFRETGDRTGEARALGNLSYIDLQQGHHPQATEYTQQALALYRETGDRTGEARALGNLGMVEERLGRYEQATGYHQLALVVFREADDQSGIAYSLVNLGILDLRQGRPQQATNHLQQALALLRETGDRSGEASAITGLGDAELRLGRYQQAAGHYQHALALFREIGERAGEAEALNALGEVFLATGRPGQARTQYSAALGLAARIGEKYEQARAHDGLARAHQATGDHGQASQHWQEALDLYIELGSPEADQVRAQLAGDSPLE